MVGNQLPAVNSARLSPRHGAHVSFCWCWTTGVNVKMRIGVSFWQPAVSGEECERIPHFTSREGTANVKHGRNQRGQASLIPRVFALRAALLMLVIEQQD